MQAPPKRDPLGPASKNHLNRKPSPALSGRKRKRTQNDDHNSDSAMLSVNAADPDTKPHSAVFNAITAVSRADLPLTWVEQTSTSTELPAGYRFKSPHTSLNQLKTKHVMLARLKPRGCLYALEPTADGIFVAVLLNQWVTEEMAQSIANESRPYHTLPPLVTNDLGTSRPHSRAGSTSSARSFRLPTPSSPRKPTNKKGAMAREAIMKPRPVSCASSAVETPAPGASVLPQAIEPNAPAVPHTSEDSPQPSVEPMLIVQTAHDVGTTEPPQPKPSDTLHFKPGTVESLRMQYLESLYLARTSLTFYAKSSLARARGQLKGPDATLTVVELKELYDSGILTPKRMEKKYKDSIPSILKDDSPLAETKKRKKKAVKGLKFGKNCLYTGEDDLLKKWWAQEVSEHNENGDAEMKKRIGDLRIRETEMQVLLVLEALVLETTAEELVPRPTAPASPVVKNEPQEESMLDKTPEAKKKNKPRNYLDELETLLERLCIWHAVTLDDYVDPSRADGGGTDRLKNFCTDIAIPFYASKIPAHVKTVCKKLGGPSIAPQGPKLARTHSSGRSSTGRPRPQTKTSSKTSLQRVLSEDQDLRHASPPVLSRSASEKGRSSLKREPSEIMSRPASRAGMQRAASFSNREVDLEADARTQEAKRRKLEKVASDKKQLQDAIQALKKPNRTIAAKQMMDEAERRAAAKEAVQITATPRKVQRRGFLAEHALHDSVASAPEPDPVIPSSTIKPTLLGLARVSAQKRAVLNAIHDTPTRGESKTSDPLNLGMNTSGGHMIAATPATTRTRTDYPVDTPLQNKMSRSSKSVLFTPMKRSDVTIEDAFKDAPEIPEKAGKAMDRVMGGKGFGDPLFSDSAIGSSGGRSRGKEDDLYAQLGWNDDFADL